MIFASVIVRTNGRIPTDPTTTRLMLFLAALLAFKLDQSSAGEVLSALQLADSLVRPGAGR